MIFIRRFVLAVVRKESFRNGFTINIAFKQLKLTEKIDELIYVRGNCLDSVCIMLFFIVNYCKCQVESFIAV